MKTTLLLILISVSVSAQIITTYDSRTNGTPIESNYRAIDLQATNDLNYIQHNRVIPLRSIHAPALIDVGLRLGFTITGTIAQAEADLNAAISNQLPATARLRGQDRRAIARQASTNAAAANSVPALRAEVARLADIVESMLEDRP